MPQDDDAWEAYRLYQRDLLLGCLADAELLVKRTRGLTEADRNLLVSLLWEKRCQPWKFWRDEARAARVLGRTPRPRIAPRGER